MKVSAVLNNYQFGSYSYKCFEDRVVTTERIDRCHTRVVWDLENESQLRLLHLIIGVNKKTLTYL